MVAFQALLQVLAHQAPRQGALLADSLVGEDILGGVTELAAIAIRHITVHTGIAFGQVLASRAPFNQALCADVAILEVVDAVITVCACSQAGACFAPCDCTLVAYFIVHIVVSVTLCALLGGEVCFAIRNCTDSAPSFLVTDCVFEALQALPLRTTIMT